MTRPCSTRSGSPPRARRSRRRSSQAQRQVALYDARTHSVHLLRDAPGQKAALARAFVSGLQNREYGLGRTVVAERDARLAELAAGQGHAALVAARLGRVPAVPARGSRLERFAALESSFTSSVGLRFAATLQNLGGRRAMGTALLRRPESTEQLFHIDKFLERERPVAIALPAEAAGLRRASVGSFGELDVRTLLAVVGAPRVDATGSGWAGGRTAIYRNGSSEAVGLVLAWDSVRDAEQWAASVPLYLTRAFGASSVPASTCTATSCWQIGGAASRSIVPGRGRRSSSPRAPTRPHRSPAPSSDNPNPRPTLQVELVALRRAGGLPPPALDPALPHPSG